MRVYLAGDLKGDWRDVVRDQAPGHVYLDPTDHAHVRDEATYTLLDLAQLASADTIFAYIENGNPSLYGTSLELGYAKSAGKRIILVDAVTDRRAPYFGMARSVADLIVPNLADGIAALNLMPKDTHVTRRTPRTAR